MPSRIESQLYGETILHHILTAAYPESEDVVSSELPASALPEILKLIGQARADVEVMLNLSDYLKAGQVLKRFGQKNIRRLSVESAPDIDGWISHAKQLRFDLQKSQEKAQDIVEQARHVRSLEEGATDAASKVHLLEGELVFNKSLEGTLERLQALQSLLHQIQQAALWNNLPEAIDLLDHFEPENTPASLPPNSRVASLFLSKGAELRSTITEQLKDCWDSRVHVDKIKRRIRIRGRLDGSSALGLQFIVAAFKKLKIRDSVLQALCKDIETLIVLPRLHIQAAGTVNSFIIKNDTVQSAGPSSDLSAEALFSDLQTLIEYFRDQMPTCVIDSLSEQMMPHMISKVISIWLGSAVPDDLIGIQDFENTLSLALTFGNMLDACNWPGKADIDEWANSIPDLWLRKRQENALNRVRKLLSRGLGPTEVVERSETQILSQADEVFAGNGRGEDWNAGWSDGGEEQSPVQNLDPTVGDSETSGNDEQDVSAWGLDDEKEGPEVARQDLALDAADEIDEAWGWGDENEEQSPTAFHSSTCAKASAKPPPSSGVPKQTRAADRQVTLRETYTISSLPKGVLDIIRQVLLDFAALGSAMYAKFSIAKSASSLLSLPGLALVMYRAGSSSAYTAHPSGNMFIYNDSLWLAEQLQDLSLQRFESSGGQKQGSYGHIPDLINHKPVLESHGKRAYAKEMESQRIIISDLLDGAQGFMHCTEHPFNQECDVAVASTIDRIRQLYREWKPVLSHSALMQSLGSLLSTVCSKTILDIEDMSDISEPESQQLATYCARIAALEDLFTPQQPDTGSLANRETLPLTAIYTPAWLKFQYLVNILESSLVDIKYLWTKGELSLEFQTEELIDLIVALFADSPHRRSAISEIRASRR